MVRMSGAKTKTEAEWNRYTDPQAMLEFLRSDRGETRRKAGRRSPGPQVRGCWAVDAILCKS
jgi:hypothetical protein